MRILALFSLLLFTSWLPAAEPLATWEHGTGTIASAPATEGAKILPGIPVTADGVISRLTLSKAPKSQIMLSPGTTVRLMESGTSLLVYVDSGVIQGNIGDKGPYSDMHIIGAAIDIRITGTLFVVERVKADTDYIALVEGRVEVNLRKDVAKKLGDDNAKGVELNPREGIGGSLTGGLTRTDTLNSRPQLPAAGARNGSVRDDAMDGSGGGWTEDNALLVTTDGELQSSLVEGLAGEISGQISDQITQDITNQVTTEVVKQIIGGSAGAPGELGTPPGPPR